MADGLPDDFTTINHFLETISSTDIVPKNIKDMLRFILLRLGPDESAPNKLNEHQILILAYLGQIAGDEKVHCYSNEGQITFEIHFGSISVVFMTDPRSFSFDTLDNIKEAMYNVVKVTFDERETFVSPFKQSSHPPIDISIVYRDPRMKRGF